MEKSPFIVKKLFIQRMPGFRSGIKRFENLAEKINIIAGPNASGKSSTAKAIREVIWQNNKTQDLSAEAWVKVNEDDWKIEIDYNHAKTQRNGKDDVLHVPRVEHSMRYMLSLHQLIKEEESDLAKEIAREASGGFDLEATYETLNYVDKAKTLNIGEYRLYNEKSKKHDESVKKQRELSNEEEQLSQLQRQRDDAKRAVSKIDFYKNVVNYLKAKSKLKQLEEELNAFPSTMKKVNGTELSVIEENEKQIEQSAKEIFLAENELSKYNVELTSLSLPIGGVSEQVLDEIEQRVALLHKLENEIENTDHKIAEVEQNEKELLKNIDGSIDAENWKGITLEEVSNLDGFYRRASAVIGERTLLKTEVNLINKEIEEHILKGKVGTDKLTHGIEALARWLKEPVEKRVHEKGFSKRNLLFMALVAIATSFFVLFFDWIGLMPLILVPIIFFANKKQEEPQQENTLFIRQSDYEKTGLPSLANWDEENVIQKVEKLMERLNNEKQVAVLQQRLNKVKNDLEKNDFQFQEINEECEKWKKQLHALPDFRKIENKDYSTLYYFLTSIKAWQEAHLKKGEQKTKLQSLKKKYSSELEKTNDLFKSVDFKEVNDALAGSFEYKKLRNEEKKRKEIIVEINQIEREITSKKNDIKKFEEKIEHIYLTLSIPEKEKEKVRQLDADKNSYNKVEQDYQFSERETNNSLEILKNYSFYKEYSSETNDLSIDQVESKIIQLEEVAGKFDDVQERITTINTKINAQSRGNELEVALAEKEEALEALAQVREENISAAVGDLIIKHLKSEVEYKNQPKVFVRANDLLSKVTNGRYGLIPLGGETAEFRANDMMYNRSHGLSELSTGTRIQLLLAVRIAYIESIETTTKLPLLIDELLANSDDERALAIIQTLIQISKDGRQIFYFTAQTDEVRKWESYLEKENLEYNIIQLETSEEFTTPPNSFNYDDLNLVPSVPSPHGKTHAAYKETIKVPAFSLSKGGVTELHLWYLIDDVELLHRCLTKGINFWGQLKNFVKAQGEIEGIDEYYFHQLEDKSSVFSKFLELYQRGRPTEINRQILSESGAVSNHFINEIHALLESANNNPEALLEKLKNEETRVPRFARSKIDDLENYLIENDFIDQREILAEEDILVQLQAFISTKKVKQEEVNQLIKRVVGKA